mmetsp:Transcript_101596/g.326507  ORF Transcript_101596/g.326507 Transcript_101596/m.326507 type:complete len:233 (+) Transcript_101596:81-779(+)
MAGSSFRRFGEAARAVHARASGPSQPDQIPEGRTDLLHRCPEVPCEGHTFVELSSRAEATTSPRREPLPSKAGSLALSSGLEVEASRAAFAPRRTTVAERWKPKTEKSERVGLPLVMSAKLGTSFASASLLPSTWAPLTTLTERCRPKTDTSAKLGASLASASSLTTTLAPLLTTLAERCKPKAETSTKLKPCIAGTGLLSTTLAPPLTTFAERWRPKTETSAKLRPSLAST